MEKINELLVVEGKHDKAKLEKLFKGDIICTNGLGLNEETLAFIKEAAKTRKIIILTDPDQPGEKIRRQLQEAVPQAVHVFIPKEKAIGRRNVGIEYVSDADLSEALNNQISFSEESESLSWAQYCDSGLMGNKELRKKVCDSLHIALSNNKTLYKRLNMLEVDNEQLLEIING